MGKEERDDMNEPTLLLLLLRLIMTGTSSLVRGDRWRKGK